MLTFQASDHTYRWNGDIKASVTTILNEWSKVKIDGFDYYVHTSKKNKDGISPTIPAHIFEAAGDHGRAVHDIFRLVLLGAGVNTDVLHPDLLPALKEAERFKAEDVEEIIILEEPLYSEKHDYAGTPDFYGKLRRVKRPALLDFKSGALGLIGPQTSGYEQLVREKTGYRGIIDRYCLHIPKMGEPRGPFKIGQRGDFKEFKYRHEIYKLNMGRK